MIPPHTNILNIFLIVISCNLFNHFLEPSDKTYQDVFVRFKWAPVDVT